MPAATTETLGHFPDSGGRRDRARTLVLLRHGQSSWNLENRFTGWWDVGLTDEGQAEARNAGAVLASAGIEPDVAHTSVLRRAIQTANTTLDEMGRAWLPVRRHWRLNERHYGALTGLNKAETAELHGAEQVHLWRRSYEIPPPPMPGGHPFDPNDDARYSALSSDKLPRTECLADVVARLLPYWHDAIAPDLAAGHTVLVAAHGNSLRALVKHLDGIGDAEIADLNIPTGVPLVYELNDGLAVAERRDPSQRYLR